MPFKLTPFGRTLKALLAGTAERESYNSCAFQRFANLRFECYPDRYNTF